MLDTDSLAKLTLMTKQSKIETPRPSVGNTLSTGAVGGIGGAAIGALLADMVRRRVYRDRKEKPNRLTNLLLGAGLGGLAGFGVGSLAAPSVGTMSPSYGTDHKGFLGSRLSNLAEKTMSPVFGYAGSLTPAITGALGGAGAFTVGENLSRGSLLRMHADHPIRRLFLSDDSLLRKTIRTDDKKGHLLREAVSPPPGKRGRLGSLLFGDRPEVSQRFFNAVHGDATKALAKIEAANAKIGPRSRKVPTPVDVPKAFKDAIRENRNMGGRGAALRAGLLPAAGAIAADTIARRLYSPSRYLPQIAQ